MKKINSKGFTLIELLAVITIMGILMMVAIPSVSRTIENARRDTFATTAKTYINAVREAALADNLMCGGSEYSKQPDGLYYYEVDSSSDLDLLEAGGKSSWGNANVKGIVVWSKVNNHQTFGIMLCDSGNHGIKLNGAESTGNPVLATGTNGATKSKLYSEDLIKRNIVVTSGCTQSSLLTTAKIAKYIVDDSSTETTKPSAVKCQLG